MFRSFFLKVLGLAEFLILKTSLFHSDIAEVKSESLNLSCFNFIGILVLRSLLKLGIKLGIIKTRYYTWVIFHQISCKNDKVF